MEELFLALKNIYDKNLQWKRLKPFIQGVEQLKSRFAFFISRGL